MRQLRSDWGGGGFVCPCACVCAGDLVCALACELRVGRRIPRRSGDCRVADLPTYLRSIEVWS
jgi:hypothetical protein